MTRKFVSISKSLHKAVVLYAKSSNLTIKSAVEQLINIGLRYEKKSRQRPESKMIFDQRLPEFRYTVKKSERTYLAVSPKTYARVKSYSFKKGLTMVEGMWWLLFIGQQYSLVGDPEKDPEVTIIMDIQKKIEKKLAKIYGLPIDKYLNTEGQDNLEDMVLANLNKGETKKIRKRYSRIKLSDSTFKILMVMENKYVIMLRGIHRMVDELEKKNRVLERKIVQLEKLPGQRKAGPIL